MTQGVSEFGEVPPKGQRDPSFEEVGGAQESFGRGEREDVGLLKIGMRGIDDQRDPSGNSVTELQ